MPGPVVRYGAVGAVVAGGRALYHQMTGRQLNWDEIQREKARTRKLHQMLQEDEQRIVDRESKRPRIEAANPLLYKHKKMARKTAFHSTTCVEKKYFDHAYTDTALSTSGQMFGVIATGATGIAQDNTVSGRNGTRVFVYSIDEHLSFNVDSTNSDCNIVRVMLFVDKQANGVTPAVTDLLEEAHPNSFRNLDNVGRFRVLKDFRMDLTNTGGSGTTWAGGCKVRTLSSRHPGAKSIKVQYSSGTSTGVISTIRDNNIWMLVISSTANVKMTARSRVRYSD